METETINDPSPSPSWACDLYGRVGHNSWECPECTNNQDRPKGEPTPEPLIKDSGTRSTFSTGAVRDGSTGKGRFDLLPFDAIQRVAKVFERGAEKYAPRNWEKGIETHRYLDSGLRHALKYLAGYRDEDHAAMAAWNFLCLIQTKIWIDQGRLPASLDTLPPAFNDAPLSADWN